MLTGCKGKTKIREIEQSYSANCFNMTSEQTDIVRTVAKFYGDLHISQPSYYTDALGFFHEELHHAGTKAVDFGANNQFLPDILRAFITLSAVWGGGLGIGLNEAGKYSAQLHLHVDGRMGDGQYRRWIEVGRSGNNLLSVVPSDEYILQDVTSLKVISRSSLKGVWKRTLDDARRIYGYYGGPDQAVITAIKGSTTQSQSGLPLPLIGAFVGGAIGYSRHKDQLDFLKLSLYTGAGLGIGAVLKSITNQLPSFGGQQIDIKK